MRLDCVGVREHHRRERRGISCCTTRGHERDKYDRSRPIMSGYSDGQRESLQFTSTQSSALSPFHPDCPLRVSFLLFFSRLLLNFTRIGLVCLGIAYTSRNPTKRPCFAGTHCPTEPKSLLLLRCSFFLQPSSNVMSCP